MYENIYRKYLLPLFETGLKRRQTLKYWDHAEDSQWWSLEGLEVHQFKALQKLIYHAGETCPYYKELFKSKKLDHKNLGSFQKFSNWPLLTRELITQNRESISSKNKYQRIQKSTGGSSGEPLSFELNMESHERRTAMTHRGYGWAGGAPGTRQLYIWGSHVGELPKWKHWKQELHQRFNNHKIISCFEFTPEKMFEHVETWNKYAPEVIVAYTNPVYEFARFVQENQLDVIPPKSIIVGAEKLYDHQRELIQNVFQAPVFETYGSREFMLIGAECDRHSGLHLSMENLYVEILDDDGNPTPNGEEGNIVITDLYNYAMPFVRYVTGDRAVAGFEKCTCGRKLPLLKKVIGRQLDILDTPDGRKIPGEFFPHLIKDFPAIKRFQVNQAGVEKINLKIVVTDDFRTNEQNILIKLIRECIGDAVVLELDIVEDIPLNKAGKHRVVVKQSL